MSAVSGNQVFNLLVDGSTDAFYTGDFGDVAEGTILLTVVNDVLCPRFANSGEGLKQPRFSPVDVNFLGFEFYLIPGLFQPLSRREENLYVLPRRVSGEGERTGDNDDRHQDEDGYYPAPI